MDRKLEKAQISVLLAIVFVLLLAFLAFAIDGGMIYSDRRHNQNVSDSSALAGGAAAAMIMETNFYTYSEFSCADPIISDLTDGAMTKAIEFAVTRANINNFADFDDDLTDNHGVNVLCFDGGGTNNPAADKRLEIHVMVSAEVDTNFMHFFYQGPVVNVVDTVVAVRPRRPLAFGNAVVALSTDCSNSMEFAGTGSDGPIEVVGGNIVSNGCYNISGNTEVIVSGPPGEPGIYYNDDSSGDGKWIYSQPYPQPLTEIIPTDDIPEPDCSGLPTYADPNVKKSLPQTIQPGNYPNGITVSTGASLFMESGLYCVSGDMKIGGKIMNKAYDPTDGLLYQSTDAVDGVTIFLQSGDFILQNANTEVKLHAPRGLDTVVYPAMRGMLIFSSYTNTTGIIDLSGGANGFFIGTIFAPTSHVDLGGNSDLLGNCQVVAYSVTGHGTEKITVNYTDSVLYMIPNYTDLAK